MIICRGVEVNWDKFVEITNDQEAKPESIVNEFIIAFEDLLKVNQTLLEESLQYNRQAKYLGPFIEIFGEAKSNVMDILREYPPDTDLRSISESLILSCMSQVLKAYAGYADAPLEAVSMESKIKNAEIVQDSAKDLINKAWSSKWVDPIFKTLNGVMNIFRES